MSSKVVCIEREYGSNGRNTGEWLGKKMGISCYDRKKVVEEAIKREVIDHEVEVGSDEEFQVISKVIPMLVKERSCIFVGCCASKILADHPKKLTVFIYADMESRIQWVMGSEKLNREEAIDLIVQKGKQRMDYHDSYSDTKMEELSAYDLAVSSSRFGVDVTSELIHTCVSHI